MVLKSISGYCVGIPKVFSDLLHVLKGFFEEQNCLIVSPKLSCTVTLLGPTKYNRLLHENRFMIHFTYSFLLTPHITNTQSRRLPVSPVRRVDECRVCTTGLQSRWLTIYQRGEFSFKRFNSRLPVSPIRRVSNSPIRGVSDSPYHWYAESATTCIVDSGELTIDCEYLHESAAKIAKAFQVV